MLPSFGAQFGVCSGSCVSNKNSFVDEFCDRNTVLKHLHLKADIWPERMLRPQRIFCLPQKEASLISQVPLPEVFARSGETQAEGLVGRLDLPVTPCTEP